MNDNSYINCPFCGSKSPKAGPQDYLFGCSNHKYGVYFYGDYSTIRLCTAKYRIDVYKRKELNCMVLIEFILDGIRIKLPIDQTLTPENIEQKIKIYLIFQ